MNTIVSLTPTIARALEEKRQELAADPDPSTPRARALGELDYVCTTTGITDYVMAHHLGDKL